jgi:hypothetical protein
MNYYTETCMVTKKVTSRRKSVAPAAPTPTKNFPTAALGLAMVILTNYQAEVKQALSLILKTLT